MKRLRDSLNEIWNRLPFKRAIVTKPQRGKAVIQKVERNRSYSGQAGLVDLRIEVRANACLRHSEVVNSSENNLRNPLFQLRRRCPHSKTKQLGGVRELSELQGAFVVLPEDARRTEEDK